MADETKLKHDPRPPRPDLSAEAAPARKPPKPIMERHFELTEFKQIQWFAIADESVRPEDLLTRDYWSLIAGKAKRGNKITVWREDCRLYAEMLVVAAGTNWLEARFLFPPLILDRDEHTDSVGSDFEIRERGEIKKWTVIRRSDGNEIHSGEISQENALRWLSDYLRTSIKARAA